MYEIIYKDNNGKTAIADNEEGAINVEIVLKAHKPRRIRVLNFNPQTL